MSLKATLHSISSPQQFDCGRCLAQFDDVPDVDRRNKMLQATRNAKACETQADEPRHVFNEQSGRQMRFLTCPGNYVRSAWYFWQEAYAAYQRGILPYPGALADQPAKAMEILQVVGAFEHERALERAEEERRKQQRPPIPMKRGGPRRGR